MRLLTYSSIHSSTLLKSLLSFLTSHLLAMLLASVTAPPTPQVQHSGCQFTRHLQDQARVMLFLGSVLAIPVTIQVSP